MTDTCMMFVFFGVKLIICVQANNFSLHVYHKVLLIENCETVLANNIIFSTCLEGVHSHKKEIVGGHQIHSFILVIGCTLDALVCGGLVFTVYLFKVVR